MIPSVPARAAWRAGEPRYSTCIVQSMQQAARFTRIIIVDDEPVVRTLMCHVLRRSGYDVKEAGSATEALGILAQGGADMLVTDVRMPGIDGLELARLVRQLNPRMPILFASGCPPEAVTLPANDGLAFLEKPFSPAQLLAKVRQSLAVKPRTAPLPAA